LVVTQDTGSAIRGALRADLFFGPGHRAEHLASGMKQAAKFFVLLPRFARGE
jgi:membrane-bound lytic murein transglycosylase A